MQPNERLEIWKERRREFQKSGMTRKGYCEKNGIKESTFDYWFSRIRKLEKSQRFVEIHPEAAGNTTAALVVTVGRFRIELQDSGAVQILATVVKALESVG